MNEELIKKAMAFAFEKGIRAMERGTIYDTEEAANDLLEEFKSLDSNELSLSEFITQNDI